MVLFGHVLALAALLITPAVAKRPEPCAAGARIIGVRGNSTGPPVPYGLLTSTIEGLLERIPYSTNTSVKYNRKTGDFVGPNGVGSANLLKQIQTYSTRCPSTPIVIVGYSRGGIIAMNTVCGGSPNSGPETEPLDPKYLSNIVAIALYGEESRVAGQSYDVGTCNSYGAVQRNNAAACQPYASIIRSWCDNGDPLCCVGTGEDQGLHSQYPGLYNDALFDFVTTQYAARRQKQT